MSTTSLKELAILKSYIMWQRVRRPRLLGFFDILHQTERVLICLPIDHKEAKQAVKVVPDLIACLQAKTVTLLCSAESKNVCESLPKTIRVISVGNADRKWTGLPTGSLVNRVTGDGLNVAIDLNPNLNILTGSLCLQSGAQLRMCFRETYQDLFFNVQIAVHFDQSPSSAEGKDTKPQNQNPSASSSTTPYTRFLQTVKGMFGKEEVRNSQTTKQGSEEI